MKQTGRFELPHIEILARKYLQTDIPELKKEVIEENKSPSLEKLLEQNISNSNNKMDITQNIQDITHNQIAFIEPETPANPTFDISIDELRRNQAVSPVENSTPKINSDIEKIIWELYLQEIAENLVKPQKQALTRSLQPHINKLLDRIQKHKS